MKKDNAEYEKTSTSVVEKDSKEKKTDPEVASRNSNVPLGAILDKCTENIRNTVFGVMNQCGIPASLMDYILCTVLTDVRDLKAKEYATQLSGKE